MYSNATLGEHTASIYIFGDQTDDFRASIRALLRVRPNPILQSFLTASYSSIRAEILQHPDSTAQQSFSDLLELLDVALEGPQAVALDHALATICHFGLFLERCDGLRGCYPDPHTTKYLGICTGSLAAAAVGCCSSPLELLPIAVRTCLLAFRAGAYAGEQASLYGVGGNGDKSWGMAVPDVTLEDASQIIRDYSSTQNLPTESQPYISCVSLRGVMISGPPAILQELREARRFRTTAVLPLYAPYHAPNLYDDSEILRLVDQCNFHREEELCQQGDIPSSDSIGEPVPSGLERALRQALKDILVNRVDFATLLDAIRSHLQSSKAAKGAVIPIASSAASNISRALASEPGVATVELVQETVQPYTYDEVRSAPQQHSPLPEIAIVGMACRLPQAAGVDEFWELLRKGLDVHAVVPPTRWDAATHVDCSAKPRKNTSATPYGCWLEDPGLFDSRFFGMSPRECDQVDPAARLALLTTYEAMEDGGIVPGQRSTRLDRVGVCYGVTSNDWMETNSAQDIDTYMIPGGNRAFIPGRINYHFKFSGPSLAIDTACSSSLAAIHTACNILWRGEADTMIAGGTNILTNPDFTAGLDRGRFLSRTGGCKTFDDEADGYCRGEGVATLILKRMDDAIADGDNIKGTILNILTNHSAESESITRPSLQAQKAIFAKALDGLSPLHISYVEMHGTGTQVGDATEMNSLLEVVAPTRGPQRRSEPAESVYLGSVKANVGHGEAVAGATGLIKLLLMMEKSAIPPHVGIKTRLNRKFPADMASRGVRIASECVDWGRAAPDRPRYALLNNFSAAGGNTTLLLRDHAVPRTPARPDPRSTYTLAVSAKTPTALQATGKAMLGYLSSKPHLSVPSLSYTTTARRIHHKHRIAVAGSSVAQLASSLSLALSQGLGTRRPVPTTIVFAFTGQGSYYIGMGRQLYHHYAIFRHAIDRYSQIAQRAGFAPFLALITGEEALEPSQTSSEAVQLAIVSLQMALTRLWSSWGITPSSVVGHSLGHYAALNAARVVSEADTIFLVGTRARLLQEKCQPGTHKMLRVRASQAAAAAAAAAAAGVEVACINGPADIVISGPGGDFDRLSATLARDNVSCQALSVPFAFHSSQVDGVLGAFQASISGVRFHPPQVPVICPRQERVLRGDARVGPAHLADHLRHQVNFVAALEAARAERLVDSPDRTTIFLEIGHTGTLTGLLKGMATGAPVAAFPSLLPRLDPWKTVVPALNAVYQAGVRVQWDAYHRGFPGRQVLPLPHYQWDLANHWIQYRNDWSLRKGDPAAAAAAGPSLLSTTIHEVVQEGALSGASRSIVLRSDLAAPVLHRIVQGHKVNGLPLVTPAVYADIALTAARYLQGKLGMRVHQGGGQLSLNSMTVERALVVKPAGTGRRPQWLQTDIEVDSERSLLQCRFSSVGEDGKVSVQHATCTVTFAAAALSSAWLTAKASEAKRNMQALRAKLSTGEAFRFSASMVYRMVAVLADFDRAYRGLQEVVLDSHGMAAASTVKVGVLPRRSEGEGDGETYAVHPACLDALTQTAGFVMNANEASDLDVECFVNHGWASLRILEPLRADREYRSYVQMRSDGKGDGVWKGDLYVLCEDRMAAIIEGITLQGLPKRLLYHVLSTANTPHSKDNARAPLLQPSGPKEVTDRTLGHDQVRARLDQIVQIVADESGIPHTELSDDTDLVLVGVDSLLALLITSRMREELDYDLGPGLSIFDRFRTLKQLKDGYLAAHGYETPEDASESSPSSQDSPASAPLHDSSPSSPLSSHLNGNPEEDTKEDDDDGGGGGEEERKEHTARPVTSLILQQAAETKDSQPTSRPTVFLFPDGSGSPLSYASLVESTRSSSSSAQITLIGLVCPYRHDPHAMQQCALDELLASYLREMQRRQPTGPYSLGGWSAGGILAYRAAQMLLDAGHAVQHLLLLDSPSPAAGLETLPDAFYAHCTATQVFGQIERGYGEKNKGEGQEEDGGARKTSQPDWLIAHFKATVHLLSCYHAEPLKAGEHAVVQQLPNTTIVWAGQSALDGSRYPRFQVSSEHGPGVRFLAEARTDYGPGGWGELLPATRLRIHVMKEYDHFSMMHANGARTVMSILDDALQTSTWE